MSKKKTPKERYEIREGYWSKIDGQTLGEEIERIKLENGGYAPPSVVVEEARPEDSPLHPGITWDEAECVRKWQEQEAGYMTRCYYKVNIDDSGREVREIANVSVRIEPDPDDPDGSPKRAYTSSSRAITETEIRDQVVEELTRMLRGVWNRYRHLPGIGDLFRQAVDTIEAEELEPAETA